MAGGAAVHYLRANAQSKQSRRHIIIDTEAQVHYEAGMQTQSWLCGVARYVDADTRRTAPLVAQVDYLDPVALWDAVSEFTRPNARTILWAHNTAYDLRISRGLEILPWLGWSCKAIVLDALSCWAKFTREGHTLVIADFASWAGVPLPRIADWMNLKQEPLPDDTADTEAMFRRCRGDVEVLYQAVIHTLGWLRDESLGNLQITGSGQAWAAFRHRFMTEKLLVHDDKPARAAERKALWTGRTEAWKHGTFTTPRTYEYDLSRAYATIARDQELPTVFVGALAEICTSDLLKWSATRRLLCESYVTTSLPLVPTSHNDRIIWPTGQFRTVLWDCEIRALLARGARVDIGQSYVYTSTKCLSTWATYILREIDARGAAGQHLQARILKQWSRALIGRFALQYRSWETFGTTTEQGLSVSRMIGDGVKRGSQLFHIGTDLLELGDMRESENALPQITGYIAAECRVRLWELMETAGLDNVYYVDTDSLIVNPEGRRALETRIQHDGAYGLVFKHEISKLEIEGPRQLTVNGDRRHSGVPKRARPVGSDEVVGEVWEGLGEALRHGRGGEVLVYERSFRLAGSDLRREHLAGGGTRAPALTYPPGVSPPAAG